MYASCVNLDAASACARTPEPGLGPAPTRKLIHTCACAWTRSRMCRWAAPVYSHAYVHICIDTHTIRNININIYICIYVTRQKYFGARPWVLDT